MTNDERRIYMNRVNALEAEVGALLARVAELEALLASLYAPIQTTFGATLEGEATG